MSEKQGQLPRKAGSAKKPMKKSEKIVEPDMMVAQNIVSSLKRVHMRVPKY